MLSSSAKAERESGISTGSRIAQSAAVFTLTWVQSVPWDDPEKIPHCNRHIQ